MARLKRPTALASFFDSASSTGNRLGWLLVGGGSFCLLLILFNPVITHLDCRRLAPYNATCQLQGYSLVGLPMRWATFEPLKGAQSDPASLVPGYSHQVMLLQGDQKFIPLSRYGIDYSQSRQQAESINEFLADSQAKTFSLWQSPPLFLLARAIGGTLLIILVGIITVWVSTTPVES